MPTLCIITFPGSELMKLYKVIPSIVLPPGEDIKM